MKGFRERLLAVSLVLTLLIIIANPVVCQICRNEPEITNTEEPDDSDILPVKGPGVVFEPPFDDIYKWKGDDNFLVKTLKREGEKESGFVSIFVETLIAGCGEGGTEVEKIIYIGKEKEITVEAEMLVCHNVGKFGFLPSGVSTAKALRIGSEKYYKEMDKFWNWDMFFDAILTVIKILFPEAIIVDMIDVIDLIKKIEDAVELYEFFEDLEDQDQAETVYIEGTKTVKPGLVPLRAGVAAISCAAASYAASFAMGMVTKISVYGMDPPDNPIVTGDNMWKKDIENEITITCSDKNDDNIYFRVDWGDYDDEWTDEITSGSSIKVSHTYDDYGDYTIEVQAFDSDFSGNYNPDMKSEIVTHQVEVEENWPPIFLKEPQGPTKVRVGQQATYTTSAFEHDGDPIYYQFDWFYGEQTDWLGPYQSEETVSVSHAWDEIGSPLVCVRAIDDPNRDGDISDGRATDWECISIEVPRGRNYKDLPIFEKIKQIYLSFLNSKLYLS